MSSAKKTIQVTLLYAQLPNALHWSCVLSVKKQHKRHYFTHSNQIRNIGVASLVLTKTTKQGTLLSAQLSNVLDWSFVPYVKKAVLSIVSGYPIIDNLYRFLKFEHYILGTRFVVKCARGNQD